MHFKHDKNTVKANIYASLHRSPSLESALSMRSSAMSNVNSIEQNLNEKIRNAFNTLIDSIYTDQEFESDIGLTEKLKP